MWHLVLHKFEEYMRLRRFSPRTIETYMSCVRDFCAHLHEKGVTRISEVDKEVLKEYQHFLFYFKRGDKGLAHRTQSLKLSAVKCLCKFLVRDNYLLYDPSQDIGLPKVSRPLPRDIASPRDMVKLLSAPASHTSVGIRDRAILELLYSTGMRNTELRCLRLRDLDMRRGEVRISFGKGGKSRIVPLGEVAAHFLSLYLEKSRPHLVKVSEQDILFVSWRGNKLSKGSLGYTVQKYAAKAKLKKKITCHTLRHTCATHMLKGRADLRSIQELLGHRSLSTTQIYTRVELSDLKRVHRACHPRNKL